MKLLDIIVLAWLATFNLVTFLAFGFDKWRASRPARRTPESTLLLLAALGGWPGGLLGMNLFRHKTAKWTFKIKFVLAVIPLAIGVWAWLHFHQSF